MSQSSFTVHCINPDCPNPTDQPWGNNFCQNCGTSLRLQHRYIPLQRLGSGGFAAIYTIWDLEAVTEKVLKVLLEPSPKARELFEQEAAVLASLRHPGIPKVEADGYFFVETRNLSSHRGYFPPQHLPCLVMEKINGQTLEEIIEEYSQGCPEIWVLIWLNQALDILQELHRQHIIHRDLKPSNLMMRFHLPQPGSPLPPGGVWRGQLVAIDFGGAKQMKPSRNRESSTTRLVSPGYSPPEQIAGRDVGPTTDFYALGRTFIHLLTGQHPADLEDPMTGELHWRHRISVHPVLADLLDQMVKSEADLRPASVAEIKMQLAKISRVKRKRRRVSFGNILLKRLWEFAEFLSQGIRGLMGGFWHLLTQGIAASLDTLWAMVLGGVGGCLGAVVGLLIAYQSPLGKDLIVLFNEAKVLLNLEFSLKIGLEVLVFACAGLGTAIGLTDAGSFNQKRQYGLSGVMGFFSYGIAALSWPITQSYLQPMEWFMGISAITSGLLTLGLGLQNYHLLCALCVAIIAAFIIEGFTIFDLFPDTFFQLFSLTNLLANLPEFFIYIGVFGLLGSIIGIGLGISHYLMVPFLRWLDL